VANPNPWKARLTKALRGTPGSIEETRRRTWAVLCLAYEDCGAEDPDQRRKAVLAYGQLVATYVKLCELTEVEARLAAVEVALHRRPP
jgi:hypothetical protein